MDVYCCLLACRLSIRLAVVLTYCAHEFREHIMASLFCGEMADGGEPALHNCGGSAYAAECLPLHMLPRIIMVATLSG